METRKIHDESGEWLVNTCQYAFVDPTTGCRFEPGVPTKAKMTDWIGSQPVIKSYKVEAEVAVAPAAPASPLAPEGDAPAVPPEGSVAQIPMPTAKK